MQRWIIHLNLKGQYCYEYNYLCQHVVITPVLKLWYTTDSLQTSGHVKWWHFGFSLALRLLVRMKWKNFLDTSPLLFIIRVISEIIGWFGPLCTHRYCNIGRWFDSNAAMDEGLCCLLQRLRSYNPFFASSLFGLDSETLIVLANCNNKPTIIKQTCTKEIVRFLL